MHGPIGAWAYDRGFEIPGANPSRVVADAYDAGLLVPGCGVVDLGCGRNPRNALFLAHKGHWIDCVDIEPVELSPVTATIAAGRITAYEVSVLDFMLEPRRYGAAVLARLVQYIDPQNLPPLMSRVAESMQPDGILMLSYTADGGIHNHAAGYNVPTYKYPIDDMVGGLQMAGFSQIRVLEGESRSVGVPHHAPAVTFDITARVA